MPDEGGVVRDPVKSDGGTSTGCAQALPEASIRIVSRGAKPRIVEGPPNAARVSAYYRARIRVNRKYSHRETEIWGADVGDHPEGENIG
jgi:hypothetical protein